MRHRLVATTTATLVLALAGFTGTSLAGNGNGNGNGNGGGNSQSSQPSQPSHPAQSNKPAPAPTQPAPTTNDNSTGVKPSSSTNTDPGHNSSAPASSNKTKQYGNGKTAGQIATAAGAGDKTLHGPGNSQPHKTTACGHSHDVDVHALKSAAGKCGSAAPAVVKHAQKTLHAHTTPPAKHETPPAAPVKPAAAAPAPAMAHVTICHATGSSSNPYVRISPSVAGVFNGHLGHQDGRDIVPPFTYNGQTFSENWDSNGQAIYNNGCAAPAPAAPAVAAAAVTHSSTPSTPAAPAAATPAAATPNVVIPAAAAPAPAAIAAGGVKGATVTLKPAKAQAVHKVAAAKTKAKPAGGVLGTTTHLGHVVASSRLPFTGLPLWIFVAVAAALILAGAAIRRSANDRI